MLPRVSIVIPAKNEEANIAHCLESIRALDYCSDLVEVTVVDNGSGDQTVSKARSLGAKVLELPRGTISELRNLGASSSTGELLAFVDADVCVEREWLLNAVNCFQETGAVCVGASPAIPEANSWVERAWHEQIRIRPGRCARDWIASMNLLVKRESFQAVGGFDPKLYTCEDVDLGYRLGRLGPIVSDKSIRAVHYGEAKSLSGLFRKESWRGISNFDGILQHGIVPKELRSHFVALFYWTLYPLLAALLLTGKLRAVAALFLFSLLIPLIKTWSVIRFPVQPLFALQLFLVWWTYCWARGFSGFLLLKRKLSAGTLDQK